MSLFRRWHAQYGKNGDNHPEYVRDFHRSNEIDSERYSNHPWGARVLKWANIPLEDPEDEDA